MVIAARKKGNLCGQGAAAKLGWVHGIGNPEGRLGDGALFTFPYFKVHFVCVCVWWVCGWQMGRQRMDDGWKEG